MIWIYNFLLLILIKAIPSLQMQEVISSNTPIETASQMRTQGNVSASQTQNVDRIIHGQKATFSEQSYQVSLQLQRGWRSKKKFHFCGGTLISSTMVATAAHCVNDISQRRLKNLKVFKGMTNIGDKKVYGYEVKKMILHDYNTKSKVGDLALLEIHSPREKDNSRPLSLCPQDFQPHGTICVVSGWGDLKPKGGRSATNLQKAQVAVLEATECQRRLKGLPWDEETSSMICAGGKDKDACQGDSGGPLMCVTPSGSQCLAGIVSWGVGCATWGVPGVYTNVMKYDQWIKHYTSGGS